MLLSKREERRNQKPFELYHTPMSKDVLATRMQSIGSQVLPADIIMKVKIDQRLRFIVAAKIVANATSTII